VADPTPAPPARAIPAAPPAGAVPDWNRRLRPEPPPARSYTRHLSLFTLGMIVIISAILALPVALPGRVQLALGQPAPTDIFAPQYFSYKSEVLTDQDRATARAAVGPVYDTNTAVVEAQRQQLNAQLTTIEALRAAENSLGPTLVRPPPLTDTQLTPDDMTALLNASFDHFTRLRYDTLRVYDNLMTSGKIADATALNRQRVDLPSQFTSELTPAERQAAADLVAPRLAINLTLNEAATEARRKAAEDAVQPRVIEVQKGESILRVGQIADAAAIEKLEKAGLSNPTVTAANAGAVIGCVVIMFLLLHFYLLKLQQGIWRHHRPLILLALVLVAPTLIMRVIVPGHAVWPYMLPLAASSMLVAVLLDANLAIVITFVLGVFAALLTQGNFDLPFYYFVGGTAAVFAIWRAERVSTFVVSGAYVAVSSLAATLLMRVVENQRLDLDGIEVLAVAAGINGALAASLTFATFSLLGSWFGIATMLQLLELAHPTQPLLRRLMREAPGTYHHSLVVSNLAERAAELVGADPLLARVAAYYHDIGKVLNPYAFIENQSGMGNIHDTLDPVTSARLIREHITEGKALAERSRLPRRVIDCIPQHHGTTVVKYFYHKALQDDPTTSIDEFRCPGPKPQTKEAAILMLADSVEATVRSVAQAGKLESLGVVAPLDDEPPANSIPGIVRRTIKERLEDGQLDECDLTIRDLSRIQDAFYSMLSGIYHPRIVYPDKPTPGATPAPVEARPAERPLLRAVPMGIRRPFGAREVQPGPASAGSTKATPIPVKTNGASDGASDGVLNGASNGAINGLAAAPSATDEVGVAAAGIGRDAAQPARLENPNVGSLPPPATPG
jgi:cyclic-di-AMP phosphodiesterase PgpH